MGLSGDSSRDKPPKIITVRNDPKLMADLDLLLKAHPTTTGAMKDAAAWLAHCYRYAWQQGEWPVGRVGLMKVRYAPIEASLERMTGV
ncbi:hypothetical protein GCM10010331_44210 [Streptomyces xanthochromogenes]|uniref:hypothetical protein n=1 Tax=Streptomyces xanthochromogenes TaxID=67384 RepID=UPI0016791E63|nr:hypothetical protein [Streptomyces xanthochromogenes]GHB51834.1 hypothetical protein GCM10010331_44210 [Streptomyces xanthochromogenes]